jgi:hypothetical protein
MPAMNARGISAMEQARQAATPVASATRLRLGGVRGRILALRDHSRPNPPLATTGSAVVSHTRAEAVVQRYPRAERPPAKAEIGRHSG